MANSKATEGFEEGAINERDPKKFVTAENVSSFSLAGFLSSIMSAITPAEKPDHTADGPAMTNDMDDYENTPSNGPRPGGFPG
jgi:hypothetical protein